TRGRSGRGSPGTAPGAGRSGSGRGRPTVGEVGVMGGTLGPRRRGEPFRSCGLPTNGEAAPAAAHALPRPGTPARGRPGPRGAGGAGVHAPGTPTPSIRP